MEKPLAPIEVFYSCSDSPTDAPLLEQLERHLSVLQREGLIATWHKHQIAAGSVRQVELDWHLNTASLILLLVSSDFLVSEYCYGTELQCALQRHATKEAQVIPILLRSCVWQSTPFAALEMLPTGAKPITMWRDRDAAWTDVVRGIRNTLKEFLRDSEKKERLASKEPQPVQVPKDSSTIGNDLFASSSSDVVILRDKTFSSPLSRPARFGASFPEIWNVFRRHTPFFTGRSQVLEQLFEGFRSENEGRMIWPQVITGLGGIGKTQTAAEYAYRFRENYRVVLWVRAETRENLFADFRTIAMMLKLPQEQLQDRTNLVQAMKEWFRNQSDWLLILDNADNPALVDPFLPRAARGHLLLTTRAGAMIEQAQPLQLQPLEPEDGALCLLRRAGLLAWNKPLQDASAASIDAAYQLAQLMDGLPLALEQAGAYINDTACGVKRYLHLYQQYRSQIQHLHHGTVPDYPEAVASAWSISRNIVEQSNPAAAELLRFCAFLAPEAIPDELLIKGAPTLGPVLGPVAANPVVLDQAIRLLRSYSLLHRDADRETDLTRLSIHRVLQEILLDGMDGPTQRLWAERAICAVALVIPTVSWQVVQAHARNCLRFIGQWQMSFPEADFIQQHVEEYSREEEP